MQLILCLQHQITLHLTTDHMAADKEEEVKDTIQEDHHKIQSVHTAVEHISLSFVNSMIHHKKEETGWWY